MIKVITYGTYDMLHYGHIRLLKRAKELGDYLIVGVTADDFDKTRGKINVQQSLMERVEAIRATGIADEIIVEEYEGQKIDDIRKYDIDIFTVGSDWKGKFDYLNEYCKVIYLDRTQGVSSSEIRDKAYSISLGLVGDGVFLNKMMNESKFVNGINIDAIYTNNINVMSEELKTVSLIANSYEELLNHVDAVYIRSLPKDHYLHIKLALEKGKHVLCESPITLSSEQSEELYDIADKKNLILMEAIKTAYATAFSRLLLLIKGGKIGDVVSVDATCTTLKKNNQNYITDWSSFYEWGPTALLPIFSILGTKYKALNIVSRFENNNLIEIFSKVDFTFEHSVASIKVGDGMKSEGELIISGTKGYVYVPAPWWKTEYFEVRYEDQTMNKRYFYQLDGEGIRYELVAFTKAIENKGLTLIIEREISFAITDVMDLFYNKKNMIMI